ncbi:glutamate 5-kinase [Acinetobacter sp. 1207_04]|uniref:glutamate 5-kinase n=1 Tax=Acinetobacter sp. 1207_04 TaxID=2604449 RepID=UPI004057D169
MGLREELQADIADAFNTDLKDAVSEFTCTKIIYSGEMDFATQTYPIIGNETYSGRGTLFGSYQKDMVKPVDYQVTDCKATVLQSEVIGAPQISDVWMTVKGEFKVVNIGADPVDAIWKVQLRKE